MNWKKWIVVTTVSAIAAPTWAFSVEQAVATTIATDPELKSAFNDFMSSREDIESAQGGYLPAVDLSAGFGYEYVNNSTTEASGEKSFNRKDATLSLTQLIWDGTTGNNIERSEFEAEAQRFQLLSDAQDKTLRVTEVYVAVLKAAQLLSLSEANVEVHEKILGDIKRRAESGIGSTADLSQVEARVARAFTNMLAARSNLEDAESEFYRVVGAEPVNPTDPEVDELSLPTTRDAALERAIELNPVIKLATYDIDAARAQYRLNKGNFYPTLSFEASQNWSDDAGGVEEQVDEFSAMLRLRVNLYNGGSDTADVRRSAYQLNKSKDIFDNAYRLLEESTRLSWSAYQLTEQQKIYLAEHVDAASETVIAYEKQFRIGRRTLLDLLNTENELFEARRSYLDAHYANITAKYRVLNSTGSLLDALRVDVPQEWLEPVINGEG
ncbi:agglutination protein [Enterovibrio norvegicus]|uniref:Outer membrane protein, adhesin transport system n=1 Tax=Enterovibrio norvegicus DSM 15893 TaxID=1121869 RepID=A0A1I5VF94_9GAMM|nr:TolC family outer membrane protein [Enterovibrio norvegicus]MCC4798398.1 TolC family outer membrane protein [Enterovibrio norvegicus]OEE69137.1 agglutination protein [Enterovibrio norvegicus]PMH65361.1 agglutination protein [Enterovibrio norvegicus]PMI33220.1 agglutination protein [Enterovibrio norvegicus]PMI33574.1 agglutination protein [Enterovibrio norvegicus]